MGEYYEVVCHDCKVSWSPNRGKKLCEIQADIHSLAAIGAFLVAHRHHQVDVLGDAGDDGGCDIDMSDYLELTQFDMAPHVPETKSYQL